MRFAIFPVHLSKVLRLPRKSDARSYEVLHLSRKITIANLKIWCSKMQPLAGNHPPHLLTPMKMSLVLRLPRKMYLCRSSSHAQRLPSFLEMPQNPHVFSLVTFDKVHNPLRLPRKTTSEPPKVARTCGALCILTSSTACNFSSLIWPAGSAPTALVSLLFDPPEPQIIGKTVFRDFPTFSRICIFFLLTLSLLWSSLFYSSLLSASAHLCFSSVHIVGSLTSKLPSNIILYQIIFLIIYIFICIYTRMASTDT